MPLALFLLFVIFFSLGLYFEVSLHYTFLANLVIGFSMLPLGFSAALALVDKVSASVVERIDREHWKGARGWLLRFLIVETRQVLLHMVNLPPFNAALDKKELAGLMFNFKDWNHDVAEAFVAALNHFGQGVHTVLSRETQQSNLSSRASQALVVHLQKARGPIREIRDVLVPRAVAVRMKPTEFSIVVNLDAALGAYIGAVQHYMDESQPIPYEIAAKFVETMRLSLVQTIAIYQHPDNYLPEVRLETESVT